MLSVSHSQNCISPVLLTVWGRPQFAPQETGWYAWKNLCQGWFHFSFCLSLKQHLPVRSSTKLFTPVAAPAARITFDDAYDFVGNEGLSNEILIWDRLPFQPKVIDHCHRWSGIDPPPFSPWAGLLKSLRPPPSHLAHCLSDKGAAATPEENTK